KVELKIVGPELLLAHWGSQIISKVKKNYKDLNFSFEVCNVEEALKKIGSYGADLAIIPDLKNTDCKMVKELDVIDFQTFISKKHPLINNTSVSICKILSDNFIVNDSTFTGIKASHINNNDGWRD